MFFSRWSVMRGSKVEISNAKSLYGRLVIRDQLIELIILLYHMSMMNTMISPSLHVQIRYG